MELADEGEGLEVKLALNSYSWIGAADTPLFYYPYGI